MRCLVIEYNSATLAVIRNLGRAGFEVDLLTRWGKSPPPRSRYCRKILRAQDWEDRPATLEYWMRLFEDGQYGCIFSGGDRSARILSRHRAEFAPLVKIDRFFPKPDAFEIAISKAGVTRHAESIGLCVPRTLYDPSDVEVRTFVETCPHGVAIKRDDSFASRGVRITRSPEAAVAALAEMREPDGSVPVLAQEKVRGPGYLFHAIYWEGRPYSICLHRKAHEYPIEGGVSARGVTEDHAEPVEAGLKLLDSIGWHGIVKLDYIHSQDDGRWYLIEADPRVSASIDMTRVAAMDHTVTLARLVDGQPVQPDLRFKKGTVYRWLFPRDVLATVKRREWGRFILDFFRPNCHSDLDLRDLRPTLKRIRGTISAVRSLQAEKTPQEGA